MSPAGRNGITLKLHILLGSPCPQQWHCYKPQEKENRRGLYWSPSSLDASFHSWENWSIKSKKWPTQGHTDISRTRPGPARSPDSEGFFLFFVFKSYRIVSPEAPNSRRIGSTWSFIHLQARIVTLLKGLFDFEVKCLKVPAYCVQFLQGCKRVPIQPVLERPPARPCSVLCVLFEAAWCYNSRLYSL